MIDDKSAPTTGTRSGGPPARVRFGPFEFDRHTLELWRGPNRVKLQPQPSRVLGLLLSDPGRLVTREQFRKTVWAGRYLEFDGGLNFTIRKVREALSDDASDPVYVETVHGRGYRFAARVEPITRDQAARGAVAQRPSRLVAGLMLSATSLLIGVGILTLLPAGPKDSTPGGGEAPVIAVLPIAVLTSDSAANNDHLFARGLTEDLVTDLALFPPDRLLVIAPTSSGAAEIVQGDAKEIRRALGADYVVRGAVRSDARGRSTTVRVVDTRSRSQLWAGRYDRALGDDRRLQREISRDILAALAIDTSFPVSNRAPADLPASGRESAAAVGWLLSRGDAEAIEAAGRRLVALRASAPDHPEPWVLTARLQRRTRRLKAAERSARKAIEIAPSYPEAHAELAVAAQMQLRLPEAQHHLKQAIAQAPGVARYHARMADVLANLLEFDEAIAHIELAARLDPLSSAVDFDLYMIYVAARRWTAAREHCGLSRELLASATWPRMCLIAVELRDGSPERAGGLARELLEIEGAPEATRSVTATDALPTYLEWRLQSLEHRQAEGGVVSEYALARLAGQLGDRQKALHHLERLAASSDPTLQWAPREVWFDFMADDPDFRRILSSRDLPGHFRARDRGR